LEGCTVGPIGRCASPQNEWVPITDGKQLDREPRWSPDGNLLYFLADRDGTRGIFGQRLDPMTKHPIEGPFEVMMFRSARRSMMHFKDSGQSSPAVARDKIVFPLGMSPQRMMSSTIRTGCVGRIWPGGGIGLARGRGRLFATSSMVAENAPSRPSC